jgi:hypothetical protein
VTFFHVPHQTNRSGKPGGLGRHINHDPMSLRYLQPVPTAALVDKTWERYYQVLDQLKLGSCTGNAMLGAMYTGDIYTCLPAVLTTRYPPTEATARDVFYAGATRVDPYAGQYPPTDTGSDGLSVMKVAKTLGVISGYTHSVSLNDALAILSHTSHFITGINWYSSFDDPDSSGMVSLPTTATLEGGHEVLMYRIDTLNERVWLRNSWSTSYGVRGEFCMSYTTFGTLLSQQGDVTIPNPLSVAPPTPTPVPPVVDVTKLISDLQTATANVVKYLKG